MPKAQSLLSQAFSVPQPQDPQAWIPKPLQPFYRSERPRRWSEDGEGLHNVYKKLKKCLFVFDNQDIFRAIITVLLNSTEIAIKMPHVISLIKTIKSLRYLNDKSKETGLVHYGWFVLEKQLALTVIFGWLTFCLDYHRTDNVKIMTH